MENKPRIRCTNPGCGFEYTLKYPLEIAIKMAFNCPVCHTRFAIKDALCQVESPSHEAPRQEPENNRQDESKPEQPKAQPVPEQAPREERPSGSGMFRDIPTLIRATDGYPYFFYARRMIFGRYDDTMQADVLCKTDDLAMSRRHVAIGIERLPEGCLVDLTNLSGQPVLANGNEIAPGESAALKPGDLIRIGKTDFIVRDCVPTNM